MSDDHQTPEEQDPLGLGRGKHSHGGSSDHDHDHHHHEEEPIQREVEEDAGHRALSEALKSSFFFVKILIGILGVLLVFSCVRTVQPNENVVILRFGKPVGDTLEEQVKKPGLIWAFPYPIDEIVSIPVGESHSLSTTNASHGTSAEFEWKSEEQDLPQDARTLVPGVDGYVITSDANILHVNAGMKYRISDPVSFTFNFADVHKLLESLLDNAVLYTSARFSAEDALYKNKVGFSETVRMRLESSIASAGIGVQIEQINVETKAPVYVKMNFDAVLQSEQNQSRMVSEARGYADQTARKAEGEKKAIISDGITSSNRLVTAVSSEARYFQDQLEHFQRDPELFKLRQQARVVARVLTNAQDKYYLPTGEDGMELRLLLNREPEKANTKRNFRPGQN